MMKHQITAAALVMALLSPAITNANPITLQPADPQPDASTLKAGLAVKYTGKFNGRTLAEISEYDGKWSDGSALAGLSYDTPEGEMVLTSDTPEKVAARIAGFIKFDEPGTYMLEFLSNDGLVINIGGEQLGIYDGVHDCGYVGEVEVAVPEPGYYPVSAEYFQRKGSSCLLMEWGPDSDGLEPVPDSAFFN